MKRVVFAGAIAASAILGGCATVGQPVDEGAIAGFKMGVTTKEDVRQALGSPDHVINKSDGESMYSYVHAQAQVHPATFIPIVGIFAGGADTTSKQWAFEFDSAGRLKSSQTTEMETSSSPLGDAGARSTTTMQVPEEQIKD